MNVHYANCHLCLDADVSVSRGMLPLARGAAAMGYSNTTSGAGALVSARVGDRMKSAS